jgi:hypothetical protein
MLNESIQAPIVNAPKRGSKLFDPCPIEGNGVHNWLFKTALRLHGRIAEDEIIELLKEKLSCVRPEREIREAVVNAGKYAKGEAGSASYKPWPSVDHALVYEIVVYGERPFVITLSSEAKKGVGSLDESLSEALLSGAPFIALDNLRLRLEPLTFRGEISNQLLESAIRGEGKVAVRRAYSRTTQIETDHVYWLATSNRAQTTPDLANRSIITRLRKCAPDFQFKHYVEGDLLTHIEKQSDYYMSCVFTIIREWHVRGKPRTHEARHDFREWDQTLDWILQNIFKLPPLLDGHCEEQLRIASPGLSLLRELAFAVDRCGESGKDLSATELALFCEIAGIEVPRCSSGADVSVVSRRIGSILAPLFRESEELVVEGFVVKRIQKDAYDEIRKENRSSKFYRFTQVDR